MQPIIANGFACVGDGVIDWRAAHGPAVGEPKSGVRSLPSAMRASRSTTRACSADVREPSPTQGGGPSAALAALSLPRKANPYGFLTMARTTGRARVAAQRHVMKRRARLCLRGVAIVYCGREKAYRLLTPTAASDG